MWDFWKTVEKLLQDAPAQTRDLCQCLIPTPLPLCWSVGRGSLGLSREAMRNKLINSAQASLTLSTPYCSGKGHCCPVFVAGFNPANCTISKCLNFFPLPVCGVAVQALPRAGEDYTLRRVLTVEGIVRPVQEGQ